MSATSATPATPTTEASVGDVEVLTTQWSYSYGMFQVDALVVNHTNHPVVQIRLQVDLVDAAGTVVAHNDPTAASVFLPVDIDEVVAAPVFISTATFPGSETSVVDARVTVAGWERPTVQYLPVDVNDVRTVTGSQGTNFSGGAQVGLVLGELHNPGVEAVRVGMVNAVVLGPDGLPSVEPSLISAVFVGHLAPGESQPFRLQNVPIGLPVESLRIKVWATADVGEATDAPLSVEPGARVFRRADGVVNVVGALRNDSDAALSITNAVFCIIRDASGALVDVISAEQEGSDSHAGGDIFGSVPAGWTVGFVCAESLALSARPDSALGDLSVDYLVEARAVLPSGVEPAQLPFTISDPVIGGGSASVDITFTNDTSESLPLVLGVVLVRDATGAAAAAGVTMYCLQNPTGCTSTVVPGATLTVTVRFAAPLDLDGASADVEVHVVG